LKRTLLAALITLVLIPAVIWAANEVQTVPGTEVDSATSITTTYSAVDSITFQIDDAKNEALLFISGELYLLNEATGYIAISTSATGSNIILSADTLFANTEREYYRKPGYGNPDMKLPFFFTLPVDSDSTGQDLKFYLNAKKLDSNTMFKLYNIRMDAIVNTQNDSI